MTEHAIFIEDNASNSQSGPYSMGIMDNMVRAMMGWPDNNKGVILGAENELAASVQGGAVRIASGYAHIHGMIYWNDANADISPTVPVVGTTRKRIVLRKEWDDPVSGSISVTLTVLEGTDGSTASSPALTQTDGTRWEIPLCYFDISTAAVISNLTDEREYISIGMHVAGIPELENGFGELFRWEERKARIFYEAEFLESANIGDSPNEPWLRDSQSNSMDLNVGLGAVGVEFLRLNGTAAAGHASVYSDLGGSEQGSRNPRVHALATLNSGVSNMSNIDVTIGLQELWDNSAYATSTSIHKAVFRCEGGTGNMFAVCCDGSAETTVDLGVDLWDDTQHAYEVYTDDDGVTWTFVIDGDVVATITTNVPPAAATYTGVGAFYPSTVDASISTFLVLDYLSLSYDRT